jgi:RecA-family ATPase
MREEGSSQQRYNKAREQRREKYRSGNGAAGEESSDRFRLTAFDAIKFSTAPTYLVKGIIPRIGLIVIWGPPKCGKSFWTFDLMMHVALGWSYRGRRVKQGAVVYLALEGKSGFTKRVEAWRQRHLAQDHDPVPFYLLDTAVDMVADHAKLIVAIKAQLSNQVPAAVVIDTLNRALVGDENKSDDMAKFIRAADAVRAAFGCLVAIVHHCGIQGTRPRGHTSLAGADDAQIAIERDEYGVITARVRSGVPRNL